MSKLQLKAIQNRNKILSLDDIKKMVQSIALEPSQRDNEAEKFVNFYETMIHSTEYDQAVELSLLRDILKDIRNGKSTERKKVLSIINKIYDLDGWQKDPVNSAEFLFSYLTCKQKTADYVELKTNLKNSAGKQLCISGYRVTDLKGSDETNRANKQKFLRDSYGLKDIEKLISSGLFYPQESIYQPAESGDLHVLQLTELGQLGSVLSRKLLASDVQKNYSEDADFFEAYVGLIAEQDLMEDVKNRCAQFAQNIMQSVNSLYDWHMACKKEQQVAPEGSLQLSTLEVCDELLENTFAGAKKLHQVFGQTLVHLYIKQQGKMISLDEYYKKFGTFGDGYSDSLKLKKGYDDEALLEDKDTTHMC